jgi:hypothetical protein
VSSIPFQFNTTISVLFIYCVYLITKGSQRIRICPVYLYSRQRIAVPI